MQESIRSSMFTEQQQQVSDVFEKPFIGEISEADIIDYGSRTTHKATPVSVDMEKYGAIRGKSTFGMHKSLEERLW